MSILDISVCFEYWQYLCSAVLRQLNVLIDIFKIFETILVSENLPRWRGLKAREKPSISKEGTFYVLQKKSMMFSSSPNETPESFPVRKIKHNEMKPIIILSGQDLPRYKEKSSNNNK